MASSGLAPTVPCPHIGSPRAGGCIGVSLEKMGSIPSLNLLARHLRIQLRIHLAFWAVHTAESYWVFHTQTQVLLRPLLHPACGCTWDCSNPGLGSGTLLCWSQEFHTVPPLHPVQIPLDGTSSLQPVIFSHSSVSSVQFSQSVFIFLSHQKEFEEEVQIPHEESLGGAQISGCPFWVFVSAPDGLSSAPWV